MRRLIYIIGIVCCTWLYTYEEAAAQRVFIVDGSLSMGGAAGSASITLSMDGGVPDKVKFNANTGVFSVKLDFQHFYLFSFSSDGYIAKQITINTECPKELARRGLDEPFFFKVELNKQTNNIAVDTAFYNRPVGRIFYSKEFDKFDFDRDYSLKIQQKIDSYAESKKNVAQPAWMAALAPEEKKDDIAPVEVVEIPTAEAIVPEVVVVEEIPVVVVEPEIVPEIVEAPPVVEVAAEIPEVSMSETIVPEVAAVEEVVEEIPVTIVEPEIVPEIVEVPPVVEDIVEVETPEIVIEEATNLEVAVVEEEVEETPVAVVEPEIVTEIVEVPPVVEDIAEVELETPEIVIEEATNLEVAAVEKVVEETPIAAVKSVIIPEAVIKKEVVLAVAKPINPSPELTLVKSVPSVPQKPVKTVTVRAKPNVVVPSKQRKDGREEERLKFSNRSEYRIYLTTDGLTTVYAIVRYNIGQIYYSMKRPFGTIVSITREDFEQATK